jgi:hypothetical protein
MIGTAVSVEVKFKPPKDLDTRRDWRLQVPRSVPDKRVKKTLPTTLQVIEPCQESAKPKRS